MLIYIRIFIKYSQILLIFIFSREPLYEVFFENMNKMKKKT